MKVGSLFSGIGGLDLGLERAGMEVVWFVENDPFCQKVLKKHWLDVELFSDVRDVGKHNLEPVDLICGGFPCQPVSQAGQKKAQDDERWLWPEFARLLGEMGPRYALVENVPGLLARGMGDVLRDLASLGYDAEWESIPASAVGAPHRRDRIWILAHPDRERELQPEGGITYEWGRPGYSSSTADAWTVEPEVGRVANGVPDRVDRLRALGNAVVPQVAEWIGRRIMAVQPDREENEEDGNGKEDQEGTDQVHGAHGRELPAS